MTIKKQLEESWNISSSLIPILRKFPIDLVLIQLSEIETFSLNPLKPLNLPVLTKFDLIHSNNVLLSITGVSDNELVKGLKREGNKIVSDTLIIGRLNNGPLMIHI
jgi:hypothetical protein